jgi:methylase of polypeptide subunit release factors
MLLTLASAVQGNAACFATDINPRAAAATRATLARHGVVAEVRDVFWWPHLALLLPWRRLD